MKPRKLSIHEMWELHTLLNYKEAHKKYFMDIVLDIMKNLESIDFVSALKILYKYPSSNNGTKSANMFVVGLKKNNFLYFEDFINSIIKQ